MDMLARWPGRNRSRLNEAGTPGHDEFIVEQSTVRVARLNTVTTGRYNRDLGAPPGRHEESVQAVTPASMTRFADHNCTDRVSRPRLAANRPALGSWTLTSTSLKFRPVTEYPACSFEYAGAPVPASAVAGPRTATAPATAPAPATATARSRVNRLATMPVFLRSVAQLPRAKYDRAKPPRAAGRW